MIAKTMHHNLATSGWFHSPTHLQSVFCVGGFFINCCAGPPSDELFFLSSCRHLTPPFPPYPLTLTPRAPKRKEEKLLFSYSSKGHTTRLSVVIRHRRYRLSWSFQSTRFSGLWFPGPRNPFLEFCVFVAVFVCCCLSVVLLVVFGVLAFLR